ncbi:MAG: YeeE/YedE family protein [Alphaproteobacteria bacterium]|nr:YeeE/YedE family protein [Alphaproteobacteria bacterium]
MRPLPLGVAWASGALFAVSLGLAGLLDPATLRAGFDLGADWSPVPALAVAIAATTCFGWYRLAAWWRGADGRSALGLPVVLPTATAIDARLVGGSLVFGLGWGAAGLCPAPAVVGLATGSSSSVAFVVAMGVGIVGTLRLVRWGSALRRPRSLAASRC